MPGPAAKHHSTRARRNRASTRRTLTVAEPVDYGSWTIPQLQAALKQHGRAHTARHKADLIARLTDAVADVPELPWREQNWHPKTREWWRDVWSSPMSPEWTDSDIHNVYMLAGVYDDFWTADNPTSRQRASAEYRLQRTSLGLDPLSRRKLEWTIEAAGAAKAQGDKRRSGQEPAEPSNPAPAPADDPRQHLELAG